MVRGLPYTNGSHQMYYRTVYVGVDAHKDSFSLCCNTNEKEQPEYIQKVLAYYNKVINYTEAVRFHYREVALFTCGYEAGCHGFNYNAIAMRQGKS